jgi:beta-xylosidase
VASPGSRQLLAVLGALLALSLAAGLPTATARSERPAPVGSDPYKPGTAYRGDFPDPSVWRVGQHYFAVSTTVAALNLPLLTSTDLRTWTTLRAPDPSKPWLNDAMPTPASWARTQTTSGGGRPFAATWAPSVARIFNGTSVLAYSVPRASDGKRCISLARSALPTGPYVDRSRTPLACGTYGVIDPQLFADGTAYWLVYKMEGAPDRILVRRMNKYATGFAVGSRNYTLLTPRAAWEGSVIENPAMMRYRGRVYLFYSGNGYGSTKYATGYAVCKTVVGPCKRRTRLLITGRYLAGPGGATPFLDTAAQLRLAYAAWPVGNVGYPSTTSCLRTSKGCAQRRMYVATLGVARKGKLVIRRYF